MSFIIVSSGAGGFLCLHQVSLEVSLASLSLHVSWLTAGLTWHALREYVCSHGVNVQNLIQKIENHPHRHALQSDLQQHRQFNPFSKGARDVIKAAGNTELCELLDVEPKAQCKVCLSYWDIGIVYCTCGHFLRDDTTENKKYIKSVLDLFSILHYYIRKGRPHGHRNGKKEGDHEYFIANSLKKKCKKREFLSIHDRFIRDARFRKTMIEMGRTTEVIREIDKLANEDHTHHAAEEEINVYRSNWWIRSNFVGSDTMPVRHRADFKEALSTLRRLKNQEDQAYYQNWWQSSSSSWWQWQELVDGYLSQAVPGSFGFSGSLTLSTRYGTFNWTPQGDAPREPTQCLSGAVTPFVVTGLSLAKQGASAWPGFPKRGSSRLLLVGDVGENGRKSGG